MSNCKGHGVLWAGAGAGRGGTSEEKGQGSWQGEREGLVRGRARCWRRETDEGETRELGAALSLFFTVLLNLLSLVDRILSNTAGVNQL